MRSWSRGLCSGARFRRLSRSPPLRFWRGSSLSGLGAFGSFRRARNTLGIIPGPYVSKLVVITTIGRAEGRIRLENAVALVGAGMLSILLFPVINLRRLRETDGHVGLGRE